MCRRRSADCRLKAASLMSSRTNSGFVFNDLAIVRFAFPESERWLDLGGRWWTVDCGKDVAARKGRGAAHLCAERHYSSLVQILRVRRPSRMRLTVGCDTTRRNPLSCDK